MAESFSLQIDKFVEMAKRNMQEFVTEFLQDLNEEVVRNTPVDTGFLRGSWWSSIGGPNFGAGSIDKAGASAIARMNLVASQIVVGQVYYAMNGANYAAFVEYGTSKMAPRAFVRTTLARAPAIAEAAARRVASR
jgi:hypothetical protein